MHVILPAVELSSVAWYRTDNGLKWEQESALFCQSKQFLAWYGIVVDRQVVIVHMHYCCPESYCAVQL